MNQSRRAAGRTKGTKETAAERKAKAEAVRKAEEKRLAEETRREKEALERAEAEKLRLAAKGYQPLAETAVVDSDSKIGGGSITQLEKYLYFDGEQIGSSVSFPEASRNKGYDLYLKGKVDNVELSTGYDEYRSNSESLGQAVWHVKAGQSEFVTTVVFNKNRVVKRQCSCPACTKRLSWYGWYEADDPDCQYTAALLYWVRDYLKSHNIGDATDRNAEWLMAANRRRRSNILVADKTWKEESLTLKPRLVKKDGTLTASFKVGTGRLFVIKQLDEFCANVRNCATATYGSNTQINHRRSNFTLESQKWLSFIERIVQEEEEFGQRMEDAANSRYYYPRSVRVGSSLNLFGWRLDEFYNEIGNGDVEYEDRDAQPVVKTRLYQGEGNPRIQMNISEYKEKGDQTSSRQKARGLSQSGTAQIQASSAEFHGIRVRGKLPELSFGMNCAYYVSDDRLCRSEEGYRDRIGSLVSMSGEDGAFSMLIGRNNMSEFYYQVLPAMQDILEVKEDNPDRIHAFLPPQVNFVFYLDADENDAFCESYARYEDKSFSITDWLDESRKTDVETYRDYTAEQEVLYRLLGWLPQVNLKRRELSCGQDEDRIYRLMSDGVEELLSLGEVQCTDRFRSRRKFKRVKVSVGASVSSGLLDLDIITEDVPPEELLDLLGSYRAKKSYYRLKDGSYVDLNDQSLELLAELMDSMHVKPREFVQGKMHLPLYRTLYLNKMLEENESVYSDRDSRFREMVKGFKTINDADFDVPESLSKIMRPYQKDGYKWLRTLEAWQFGGILADDMGLGKTLQIIALLLSAKERREASVSSAMELPVAAAVNPEICGTSLVVAPASLVFNWGEEFVRFAPSLKILLVTGTQEERQAKIAGYRDYDVLVTSYDLLKRDIHHYEGLEFAYEVIDEAQYIKNHTTAAAKAVKVVKSRYRFALTGTPIENRLSELWSIFDYLMPGFLYPYDTFKREIETQIVKYQDEQAMKRLQKMTGPFILRRLKGDVLKDLPDKLEEVRYVRLAGEQQKLYDGQVLHMREVVSAQDAEDFNKNKLAILAELMRLRQICCNPSLCFDSYQGESAKTEACLELIQSAIDGGHRMLLFSQFTSMLEILQKRLDQEKIAYYTITGATPKKTRLELVNEFNSGEVPVFLISLKAGGVGLNLTGADVVIHYDPWWNVAAQNQATDRAHRIGQTKKVIVFKLIAKGSIEEKILKLQEDKRELADQVISGETGQLSGMTREELLGLLEV